MNFDTMNILELSSIVYALELSAGTVFLREVRFAVFLRQGKTFEVL